VLPNPRPIDRASADLAARKLLKGLSFARVQVVPFLERRLRTRIWIPPLIYVTRLPAWTEQKWTGPNSRVKQVKRALAGLHNKAVLVGDISLKDLPQDVINYWLVPHELLHTVDLDDAMIERVLMMMNLSLGRYDIADYIRKHSGYTDAHELGIEGGWLYRASPASAVPTLLFPVFH